MNNFGILEILIIALPVLGIVLIFIIARRAPKKEINDSSTDADYTSLSSYEPEPEFFQLRGRLQRRYYVLQMILIFVPFYIIELASGLSFLWFIAAGLTAFPIVKRLHDTNLSGAWYWFGLIPLINLALYLYMLFSRGSVGPNRYGPDPRDKPDGE